MLSRGRTMLMLALNKTQSEKAKQMKLTLKKPSSRHKHGPEPDPTHHPHSAVFKPVRRHLRFPSSSTLKHKPICARRLDTAPLSRRDFVPFGSVYSSPNCFIAISFCQCLCELWRRCGTFSASFAVFVPNWCYSRGARKGVSILWQQCCVFKDWATQVVIFNIYLRFRARPCTKSCRN